jgi:serine/threonine protein kinase
LIKIVKDEIKIPSYLSVSAEVRDFLDRCLQKNPSERANVKELMNHSFFKKHQDKNEKKIAV